MGKKECKRLRKEVEAIDSIHNKLFNRCNGLVRFLKFEGFEEEDEPTPNMTMDGVILVWHGDEMHINEAIDLMEENGYISINDFHEP